MKSILSTCRKQPLLLFLLFIGSAAFAFILVVIGGGRPTRISSPSQTIIQSKRGGAFLKTVKLVPIKPFDSRGLEPKEAWIETIFENDQGWPIVREKPAGERLCIRIDDADLSKSPSAVNETDIDWLKLKVTINGVAPPNLGGVGYRTGFTFGFELDSSVEFPTTGEISFSSESKGITSSFKYVVE